jgi:predicted membrane-bound mannosyltransferase
MLLKPGEKKAAQERVLVSYDDGSPALVEARRGRARAPARVAAAAGGLYMLHAAIPLAYYHPADPAEMLVYTQTSPDVLSAMREIDTVALRSGQGRQMPVLVDGEAWWPFVWYLRDYGAIKAGRPAGADATAAPPVVIVSDQYNAAAEALLQSSYVEQHLKLREWWIPDWRAQSPRNWWDWLLYRDIWNPRGSTDFYLFIRKDLAGGL